jgi:glycosyltransferase involved in cell wall biosynthesis
MEAVASEVALLRRTFPKSVVWGVSQRDGFRFSWRRGFAVSPRFAIPFTVVARMAQRAFQVNHVFGGLGDWFHLRALSSQPTILTLALHSHHCDKRLLKKIDHFVVEWPQAEDQLLEMGVAREQIDLVLPPVDLAVFTPSPAPQGPFTVLFVSSPDRKEWLHARGIDLLLETAELCREMRFILLWRPWGDSAAEVQQLIDRRRLQNVHLRVQRISDMPQVYATSHATVAPFRDLSRCKPSPNSIAESLACGRPVIVTPQVGFAEMIGAGRAGLVTRDDPEHFANQLQELRANWELFSANARQLAERKLGVRRFLDSYRRIYAALI